MDYRFQAVANYVTSCFSEHLGARLESAFVKGSVARGDDVWAVSDLDLVLAFDAPTEADTAVRCEVEEAVLKMPGGAALVIQRIGNDRLENMTEATRAFWLYSCRYDARVLYGAEPQSFLPEPPTGYELVRLIAPVIREGGETDSQSPELSRAQTRNVTKRILAALGLTAVASGSADYVAPLEVSRLALPVQVNAHIPLVTALYREAPEVKEPELLQRAWVATWEYLVECGIDT